MLTNLSLIALLLLLLWGGSLFWYFRLSNGYYDLQAGIEGVEELLRLVEVDEE